MSDLVLLNPGPACTSPGVREAMLRGDLCHREPEFADLMGRLRTSLARCLGVAGTHETVLITGSGTAAMETAVIGSVRAGRKLLVVDNGVYGARLLSMAEAHGVETVVVEGPWTRPVDPGAIADLLRSDGRIDAVACVHHETTTGLLNPIAEIGAIVRDHEAVFLVDAISSTAIESPGLAEVHADIVCGTANKGLHGVPGVSFLLLSTVKGTGRVAAAPRRSVYLDPAAQLRSQQAGDIPFTPAVQTCYALDEAIAQYEGAGGYEARLRLYRERAAVVRAGFARLDLPVLIEEPHRANSVTALGLPAGVTYRALHDELKQRGYVIYAGQGRLSETHFRIATMGEIPMPRLVELEGALEESIRHLTKARGE
ncbi:2-aminoethylphosphonate--pyruvate transaminase [Streptomyces hygroscopicus subsp. hygroscopicus]|nr:aminotransferase class V-fold PLP-dependent enzyme [Streptomyces hygroscopicus]GLX47229.1 2-aminoethylphosphonate--pyruvate transaminase [Streptomyces hygroscopicus subsp. hygroscopicus]